MTQSEVLNNTLPPTAQKLIVHLMGGLGNQMFIYSAALSIARRVDGKMELDTVSGFKRDYKYRREYLLGQFAITAQETTAKEHFVGLRRRAVWRIMMKAEQLHFGGKHWAIINEASLTGRYRAKKLYLFGYWQSEDYFKEVASVIRKEFLVLAALPIAVRAEMKKIESQEQPVAVGIRRFNERPNHESAYTTDVRFYHAALQRLSNEIPRAHIFIMTDDPGWAREHLRCPLPHTMISQKAENRRACEDLTLMRACRHFVIGNSTYHWWGAWLGEKQDSRVLVDSKFAQGNPSFYPARWQRV